MHMLRGYLVMIIYMSGNMILVKFNHDYFKQCIPFLHIHCSHTGEIRNVEQFENSCTNGNGIFYSMGD